MLYCGLPRAVLEETSIRHPNASAKIEKGNFNASAKEVPARVGTGHWCLSLCVLINAGVLAVHSDLLTLYVFLRRRRLDKIACSVHQIKLSLPSNDL